MGVIRVPLRKKRGQSQGFPSLVTYDPRAVNPQDWEVVWHVELCSERKKLGCLDSYCLQLEWGNMGIISPSGVESEAEEELGRKRPI